MRNNLNIIILTLILLAPLSQTHAEDQVAEKNILSQSVENGLRNDLALDAQDAKREATREGVLQSSALRWPTINLVGSTSANLTRGATSQRRGGPGDPGSNLPYDRYTGKSKTITRDAKVSLELSQPLYTGGEIDAKIETARLQDLIQDENYQEDQNKSIATTISKILDVLEARAILKVALRKKELLEKKTQDMQIRADYGLENISSLESTRAEYEQAEAEYASQKTTLDIHEKAYQLQTGSLLPENLTDIQPRGLPETFEEIQTLGLANNPKIRQQALTTDLKAQEAKSQEANLLSPRLSLSASGGRSISSTQGAVLENKLNVTRQNSFKIGLDLRIPLDYTGANHAGVRAARSEHASQRLVELNTRRQFVLQLYQLWATYKTAEANQKKYQAQIKAADLSLEAVQEQYNAGTLGYLNVLEAVNAAAEANNKFIRNKKQALAAAYQLLSAIGTIKNIFSDDVTNANLSKKSTESPIWSTDTKTYGAFGWKKDPILSNMKFEQEGKLP